jgi:hypothetical protein
VSWLLPMSVEARQPRWLLPLSVEARQPSWLLPLSVEARQLSWRQLGGQLLTYMAPAPTQGALTAPLRAMIWANILQMV